MKCIVYVLVLLAITVNVFAANYTLNIINVDEVGANNRIKYAYPGIEYKVVIAAYGGLWPFTWELLQSPSGMTIDEDTGEITWSSPSSGGTVEVKVTDAESNTDTESYTVSVTSSTDRFLFVDISGGSSGGAGTIGDPYEKLDDFWTVTHTGKIVYLRAGTYLYPKNGTNSVRHINRVDITSSRPLSYLGYPGETVIMDSENNGASSYCWRLDETDHYFQNITFDDIYYYGMAIVGAGTYLTVYDCIFQDTYSDSESHNQSSMNFMSGADKANLVIFGNTFKTHQSGTNYQGIEMYDVIDSVIQGNLFQNTGRVGCFFKGTTERISLRHNTFEGPATAASIEIYGGSGHHDIDVSFNFMGNDEIFWVYSRQSTPLTDIYIYRNTIIGHLLIESVDGEENYSADDIAVYNNVWQNDLVDSTPPGDFNNDKILYDDISTSEWNTLQSDVYDNLFGASGIVDTDGFLLGEYRSAYLGTRGWETGEAPDITPPVTSAWNPSKSETDVSKDTNIVFVISDVGDGVDSSTIVMNVEGSPVTPGIAGTSAEYTVTYNPVVDFSYDQVVNVTIDADDLAGTPNSMSQDVYEFTIMSEPGGENIKNISFGNSKTITLGSSIELSID